VSMFVIGGLSGIFMASTPVDIFIQDTYFIVAHIHYVVFGGSIFGAFAAIYYWFPKIFGRMTNTLLGHLHFWPTFIFFNLTFFPMHIIGLAGHMRRIYNPTQYEFLVPLQHWNVLITISAFCLGLGQLPFVLSFCWGLVTDTGSALAVPDWPTTFGYNLFLYPWSKMVGGVLYEHSHRLLGAVVGALTVALALALWRGERRRWVQALGAAAVLLVAVQGVLVGLRVLLRAETISIVHGCLAPAFFALTVVLARVTGGGWAASPPPAPGGQLRALAIAAGLVLYVQIVLGALLTHGGWVGLHLAGAAAVFVFVPIVTARARATGEPAFARPARALLGLLLVQLLLGAGALL